MKKLLLLPLLLLSILGYSQDLTLYGNPYVPQAIKLNPGIMPKQNFNLGLPAISGIQFGLSNSGFSMSDLFIQETDGLYINTNLADEISDKNQMRFDNNIELLSFGFRVKEKNFIAVGITNRVDFNFSYSKPFVQLLTLGPAHPSLINDTLTITDTGFDFNWFTEVGVSYTRQINDKLSAGIRPKVLLGVANVQTTNSQFQYFTNPNNLDLYLSSNMDVRMASLPNPFDSTATDNFDPANLLSANNIGFGVDFGAAYQYNDELQLSASVVDLGIINWNNAINIVNDAEFRFNGLADSVFLSNDSDSDPITELMDSISDEFRPEESDDSYRSALSAKINLGASYQYTDMLIFSGLLRGEIFNGSLLPSATLGAHFKVNDILMLSGSYSAINDSYDNVGLGLTANLGPVQLFVASDNVLGVSRLDYAQYLNVQFGINVITGYSEKRKEKKATKKAEKATKKANKKSDKTDSSKDQQKKTKDKPDKIDTDDSGTEK